LKVLYAQMQGSYILGYSLIFLLTWLTGMYDIKVKYFDYK